VYCARQGRSVFQLARDTFSADPDGGCQPAIMRTPHRFSTNYFPIASSLCALRTLRHYRIGPRLVLFQPNVEQQP
jgi:hypothetical protein